VERACSQALSVMAFCSENFFDCLVFSTAQLNHKTLPRNFVFLHESTICIREMSETIFTQRDGYFSWTDNLSATASRGISQTVLSNKPGDWFQPAKVNIASIDGGNGSATTSHRARFLNAYQPKTMQTSKIQNTTVFFLVISNLRLSAKRLWKDIENKKNYKTGYTLRRSAVLCKKARF